jgi:hypothetical protein
MVAALAEQNRAITAALNSLILAQSAPAPAPTRAVPAPAPTKAVPFCQIRRNTERDGIELVFPGKIDKSLSARLKAEGLFFAPSTKVWYSKHYSAEKWARYVSLSAALNAEKR